MTWLNGIIGQGIAANLGNYQMQNAAQATQYGLTQNHAYAQQQAMAAQQAYGAGMSAGAMQGINQQMRWMFDGVLVEFKDFVDLVFPEDTAEKTAFVLKYSKGEEK